MMDSASQKEFMYLFERVGEPLYLGARGQASNAVGYSVPMPNDKKLADASTSVRRLGPTPTSKVSISMPRDMPDLAPIGRLCPKRALFSYFSDSHRNAVGQLKDLLLKQDTQKQFLSMSAMCRDSANVNPQLWIFAYAAAALERPDMKGFRIPAFVEICPDLFITPSVVRAAQEQAVLPERDRKIIEASPSPTGNDFNPENRVAYFREDIGINSHHWHWHLIYRIGRTDKKRDRQGELFYYMHHSMLARYNAERLGNDLPRTKKFNLEDPVLEEGYFPKLYSQNAGRVWGTRQANTRLQDVERSDISAVKLKDLRDYRDRIINAIDAGSVLTADGKMIRLTQENGIDILGDIVEANSSASPNMRYYGSLHNSGHNLLAHAHDPNEFHREEQGVLGDTPTAMRDPVFYRWHAFIDDIFDRYKLTLGPYPLEELVYRDVTLGSVSVKSTKSSSQLNVLHTNWMRSDIDVARGLDLGLRSKENSGAVWTQFTHLNHVPFSYQIKANNNTSRPINCTVRIFMAPKLNEINQRFRLNEQRNLFFEMDKFSHTLKPGSNDIVRQSTDSAVTINWSQSFKQLENSMSSEPTVPQAVCGCGWPQHLLLPKGKPEGMTFELYVIITSGEDQIRPRQSRTEGQKQGCKESISFCGILNEKYPDKRPMGFPFDRPVRADSNNQPITLSAFVKDVPNSSSTEVKIFHLNETLNRGGGAPNEMEIMKVDSRPSSPSPSRPSSPLPSRPSSPSPPPSRMETRKPPILQRPPTQQGSNRWGNSGGGGSWRWNQQGRWGRGVESQGEEEEDEEWLHVQ